MDKRGTAGNQKEGPLKQVSEGMQAHLITDALIYNLEIKRYSSSLLKIQDLSFKDHAKLDFVR